jgi:transcriptional regulator GlxA family with amidase domain
MITRILKIAAVAAVVVVFVFAGAVFALFPGERGASARAPISAEETAQTIAALKPPKRARPVVAVVGASAGTETTDYLVPYGVLKRSGAADVFALGTREGPMMMMPALTIVPETTVAAFEARFPDGADYVIVPALHDPTDVAVRDFIKRQSARGATIVGICDGTLVLANAGLLDGRRATGHWFAIDGVAKAHPTMHHVRDRRYVADRGVVTTTGVSASLPVSLALVEAIAGRDRAEALAHEVGASGWDTRHDSGAFHLTRGDVFTIAANTLMSWRHETVGLPVGDGVDAIAVAFTADSYARTYTSRIVTVAPGRGPVTTQQGLQIVPDAAAGVPVDVMLSTLPQDQPAKALETALGGIAARYGQSTAGMVRLQLEDAGHTAP